MSEPPKNTAIPYLRPMQHREIFTTKYLREIGKHFDLQRDVPNLDAVRRHVADWQISYHNGTIIRQSEIQLQKEFLNTFFVGCLGYRGKIGRHEWELDYEGATEVDSTRADGYLGFFTRSRMHRNKRFHVSLDMANKPADGGIRN
ncbi:MAG: hypothetical protein ABMA02_18435 [Saprospiraceae bacterium]